MIRASYAFRDDIPESAHPKSKAEIVRYLKNNLETIERLRQVIKTIEAVLAEAEASQ